MKNLKQIIFAALLVAIMLTTVAVSVFAGENLTLEDIEKIVADIEALETPQEKEAAIRYAMLDFKDENLDPTAPGVDEIMARFYKQNTLCASLYLKEYDDYIVTNDAMMDVKEKYAILNSASRLLVNEYAPLASDYSDVLTEYRSRHIPLLGDYVSMTDGYTTFDGKKEAINVVFKYLDTNNPNFTAENYTENQLTQINTYLQTFADECVEFVALGQEKLADIENNPAISNKNNPLNKSNAKREVFDIAAEIMNSEYAKCSVNYNEGATALSNISMELVTGLAEVVELTERPGGVDDDEDFAYLKNAVLIDIDQIIEFGYCDYAESYADFVTRKDALNLSVLATFIDIIPTEYVDYDTKQLHFANSAIKQVRNLALRYFKDNTSDAFASLMTAFDDKCDIFQVAYDKYVVYRDNRAPLSDYANPDAIVTFNGEVGNSPSPNGLNAASGIKEYVDWNGETNKGIYFRPEGKDFYTQFSSSDLYNPSGVIFEFDITTFDDEYLASVWFNHGSTTRTSTGESLFPPNYMGILSGGNLHRDSGTSSALILEHVIVPGQWTRIALAYDASKCTYSIYVDGIIAEEGRDAKINGTITWYLTNLRINSIRTDGDKSVVMDNFEFYRGTALRTYDRYEGMSDEKKFSLYSEIYSDESIDPPVRLQAYELGANTLIANYYNAETNEYLTDNQDVIDIIKNRYLSFEYDEILRQYQEQLIFGLKEKVDALNLLGRGFDINTRKTSISSIEAYITASGDYMPKNSTYTEKDEDGNVIGTFSFSSLSAAIEDVRNGITEDNLYKDFCAKMYRYQRASTSVAKQRYYQEAKAFREDPNFNASIVYDKAYNPDKGVSNSLTLSVAWELYIGAAAEIDGMVRSDNSEIIVRCVSVIREYDTVEEWEANYDYVNEYVMIMREIINSGEYDDDYLGFTDAKIFYDQVNAYCYNVLQETHVAVLTAELDKFPLLTTYIEKIGFCLFIDNYLAENDIDYTNNKIKEVIDRYEIYIADIGAAEEDYQDVLNQNTKYFVNIVNELQTCVKFEDIKAKVDEASLYLHTMNTGDPIVEDSIVIYEEYDALIKRYEESYRQLTIHTSLIATCVTEEDMFETLVNCNLYRADVMAMLNGVDDDDESYESYVNARVVLALYDAAYAVYNAKISGVNVNIGATLKLLGTLRDPAEIDNIVASMLTKMEK